MHFSLVYKRIEYVDLKEKKRKQKYDQIKKVKRSEKKNSLLLLNFVYKKNLFKNKMLKKKIELLKPKKTI